MRHQSIHHNLLSEDYCSARRLIWSPADIMDVRQCHPDVFCHVLSSSNAPMSYIHFFPSSIFFSSLQMFRFSHNLARLASSQCFFSNSLLTCILLSRFLPLSDLAPELRFVEMPHRMTKPCKIISHYIKILSLTSLALVEASK